MIWACNPTSLAQKTKFVDTYAIMTKTSTLLLNHLVVPHTQTLLQPHFYAQLGPKTRPETMTPEPQMQLLGCSPIRVPNIKALPL